MSAIRNLIAALAYALAAPAQASDDLPLGEELPRIETMSDPSDWLLAKVSSVTNPNVYGTAILFAANEAHYFFVTNAHVLPVVAEAWAPLRLLSPVKNYQPVAFKVVGVTFGYDLAVLAVPRAGSDKAEFPAITTLLERIFYAGDAAAKVMQIVVAGFPGYPALNGRIIPAQRRDFLDDDLRSARGEQRYPTSAWSYPVAIIADDDCPPHFIRRCYHVPIVSWGFSGGAFMGLPLDTVTWPRARILGIVSHFGPLSDKTYVIPINAALPIARSFVARWQGLPVVDTDDASGTFRERTPGVIEILTGPLTGTQISPAASGTVAGGHESVGGGHESVGGGGGSEALYSSETGNAALIGHWNELVKALGAPSAWGDDANAFGHVLGQLKPLRGVLASLRYRPGVVASGQLRDAFGGEAVTSVQSFLRRYAQDEAAGWSTVAPLPPAPVALRLSGDERRGYHSFAFLGRFRTPAQIFELIAQDRLTSNPTGFPFAELEPLMAAHGSAQGAEDLIIGYGNEWANGLVTKATLTTADGTTTLRATSSRVAGDILVTFAGGLAPSGPGLYRYAGPVQTVTATRLWTPGERYVAPGYGVLLLQRVDTGYELKVVIAHRKDIALGITEIEQSFMTSEQIVVDGMYIPMSAAP